MPLKDPEARAAYQRDYALRRKAELNVYKQGWWKRRYATDPDFRAKVAERNRRTPRHVKRAANIVYRAVQRGDLARPAACQQCGVECRPEAAHGDYERPLDIRWLCRSCHRTWDAAEPKA